MKVAVAGSLESDAPGSLESDVPGSLSAWSSGYAYLVILLSRRLWYPGGHSPDTHAGAFLVSRLRGPLRTRVGAFLASCFGGSLGARVGVSIAFRVWSPLGAGGWAPSRPQLP